MLEVILRTSASKGIAENLVEKWISEFMNEKATRLEHSLGVGKASANELKPI